MGQIEEKRLARDGSEGRREGNKVGLSFGQVVVLVVDVQAINQRNLLRVRN